MALFGIHSLRQTHRGIQVNLITSNMVLADFLSEYGIDTYCTGGKVVEYPGILGGQIVFDNLARFNIDIAFFSSIAFDLRGRILASREGGVQNHIAYRDHSKNWSIFVAAINMMVRHDMQAYHWTR